MYVCCGRESQRFPGEEITYRDFFCNFHAISEGVGEMDLEASALVRLLQGIQTTGFVVSFLLALGSRVNIGEVILHLSIEIAIAVYQPYLFSANRVNG
jgi:hypothetical protein